MNYVELIHRRIFPAWGKAAVFFAFLSLFHLLISVNIENSKKKLLMEETGINPFH